jgi:chromosomal replication initiator protein
VATAIGRLLGSANAGRAAVSPLTLIGPPGSGKSLLAGGAASAWAAAQGEDAVLVITGLDLRRRFERALGAERSENGSVAALADRLGNLRLLVVEDLEGLAESSATVEFLTSGLERLVSSGAAVLVTVGKPLGEVGGLSPRLVGRLAAGLTLEVSAPAESARQELLTAALATAGRHVETSAAADLAAWLPADARRVLAVVDQLTTRFGGRRPLTRSEVRTFIAEAARVEASTPLSDIAASVARYYAMPLRTLRSTSRKAPVVLARAVTIYLARQLTPLSYDDIGRYLGGRDHTTVMHNFNRVSGRIPTDRALRSAIDDLFRKLGRADLTGHSRSAEASL